ncbi:hypothetical protein Pmani_022982 [Petrolisthes manimaculis]|uniref:MD-2-related lipid-recognition domain-containing protein n=1 Tax=Petrolisthes manimaculis TaxID=1843537 RepID=A0AAE1U1K1_9EUCA|nr:hypothetical protein Pmani_022982 [Petrolisthes manimaculis]
MSTCHNILLLVFVVVLVAREAVATIYQDCGSKAMVSEFSITNCDMPPCLVPRPSTYHVNITFTPESSSQELETIILANIGGSDFPWPGPDGCTLLEGDSCPLVSGKTYKYQAIMPVLAEYPAVSAVVTWKLRDEKGLVHVCTMLPITLI